jgi:hypothetical protein
MGLPPPDPHSLCPQLNLLNPPLNKIPGYATAVYGTAQALLSVQRHCYGDSATRWIPVLVVTFHFISFISHSIDLIQMWNCHVYI